MKLYIASDIKHARRWIKFRHMCYPQIIVVSSWIDLLVDGEPANMPEEQIKESWDNNIQDIMLCDMLMLYHEPGDRLRGVLFEAGMAFALGKSVVFVGDESVLGTTRVCFDHSANLDDVMIMLYPEETRSSH